MVVNSQDISKICILRLSAIGDVCHALSAVQSIQKTYPNAELTWIMGKIEAQLLGDIPGINIIAFDKSKGFSGMRALWKQLSHQNFDYLLQMQVALRASLLSVGIRAKYKVGFSLARAKEGQWLFTNTKLPESETEHVLDQFAEFSQFIGCPRMAPQWYIPLSQADLNYANNLTDKPYIVISPAASKDERNWLTARYAQFADYVSSHGYQVVLCGSPSSREQELAKNIIQISKSDIINIVGQTSLKQLTAVLGRAKLVLAPDSGPAHLSTTQGTPVIGLYAHSNPKRTGPYNSLQYVVSTYDKLVEQQYGKSVKELKWGARVKGSNLMQNITLDAVVEKFHQITNTSESGH